MPLNKETSETKPANLGYPRDKNNEKERQERILGGLVSLFLPSHTY